MTISMALGFLACSAAQLGQEVKLQAPSPRIMIVTNEKILDPSKALLRPLTPIPIESTPEVLAAALKGELVLKTKTCTAIYPKQMLEQFPEYANLMIAKAFSAKGERVIGRTDQDEWAKVFYRQVLSVTEEPTTTVAQTMLDTNGFSESPGEVVIDPAFVIEAVVRGKSLKTYVNEVRPSIDFKYWLGKGYNWAAAPQSVKINEDHVYATFSMTAARNQRRTIDEQITQALKSDLIFKECARLARQQLKVPFGVPVDLSKLPERFQTMFMTRVPGLLRLNGLDPKNFSQQDFQKVKVTGIGLAVTVTLGLNNNEGFVTIVMPLPKI